MNTGLRRGWRGTTVPPNRQIVMDASLSTPEPRIQLRRYIKFLTSGSRGWGDYYADHGERFLRIGNLSRANLDIGGDIQFVNLPADVTEGSRTMLQEGDLLFSITAYLGSVAVVAGDWVGAYVSQHVALCRLERDRVDPRFIGWFMLTTTGQDQLNEGAAGGTKMQLALDDIRGLRIPAVPIEEQRRIAAYLDRETARIDALIEEQQRLIEMLRERRVSEIAAEFAGAATTPLRQVIEYAQTGPFGTQLTADEYIDGGVPVINPTHIRRGVIVPDDSTTVTPEKAEDLARYRLAVGDIVLGRKGEVDKSALVDRRSAGYVCGSDAMALRPSSGTVADYLWWFLQSAVAHSQLEFWSVGATVSGLNQTTIRKVRLPLPDEQAQRRVASYLYEKTAKIDALIAETELFIELSKERRAALITAAVTGQIDVREMV